MKNRWIQQNSWWREILHFISIIADDSDHFNNITAHDVMGAGTHAQLNYFVESYELELGEEYHPKGRGWYRSKEKVSGSNPYAGYLTNKKWHLNEVLSKIKYSDILISILTFKEMAKHLLYFQQVNRYSGHTHCCAFNHEF